MKAARFDWQMPKVEELPQTYLTMCEQYQLSPVLAQLLWNRGVQTDEAMRKFMQPEIHDLHDPYLFHGMETAVERLHEAIVSDERILIYGDYDADGITSTTVLKETLELLGAQVETYLPNRFTDGYGPNIHRYQTFIESGVQLILTVDNGVSGHEAIDYANRQGVDVIVTDHHELPETLPAAYAIIHPRHPLGDYPFKDLAGVGVAFKLACALLDEIPVELFDLVAIGTIADMVSLTDENRALVIWGLQQMKQGERLGLNELLLISGEKLSTLDESTIGFSIAPRLNAIGRLGDPNPAIDLLTTFDEDHAKVLAEEFHRINQERKDLVEMATKEALTQVDPKHAIHLLVGQDWHEGILGIVAGRVMQETGKPTIALTRKEEGLVKGSGRSVEALNMFAMLQQNEQLLTTFGGHHAAVGLSFAYEDLSALQNRMNQYVIDEAIDLTRGIPLQIDADLAIESVDLAFIRSLKQLAPFGMHNQVPQFLFSKVKVPESRSIGAEQKHLKFVLADDKGHQIDGIGFGFGHEQSEFRTDCLNVVGQLTINEWNGQALPQLRLQDYQITALQIFDFRGKKYQQQLDFQEKTLFISFSQKFYKAFEQKGKQTVYIEQIEQFQKYCQAGLACSQIVFIDSPKKLELIKEIVGYSQISRIYFLGLTADDAYLDGIGSREQYGKLFKLLKNHSSLDVRYKVQAISDYTRIPSKLLIFMIQVFVELGFVTVEDGVLRTIENPEKRALTESRLYQERQQKIKSEEFLLLSDLEKIKEWLGHS
ncbi:single-stranded-DNA-specific exonuclease RecJ [Enterococcus sp. LJL98]